MYKFIIVFSCILMTLSNFMQIVNEFDLIVKTRNTSFLSCKLGWMDVYIKIVEIAKRERDNPSLQNLVTRCENDTDEGMYNILY